ncbi:CotD family spore coat protein [Neobacillus muris]|uniref:CotD family spore coat protein n=1 Tax=Neobacillus muris TaxID=2941334 RepID=UPI0020411958|nr:CotD family spore coat protein [Neobacillus muris]
MGRERWYRDEDPFIQRATSMSNSNNNGSNAVAGAEDIDDLNDSNGFNGDGDEVETIVSPTETIVNRTTNRRTVRRVHPTHIVNVNRNITRIENFYPVTESVKNINVVEEFDCGSDLRNPRCKPVKKRKRHC